MNADKHPEFLGGGCHEHGLALTPAGLERHAGVAHLAGHEETFQIGKGEVLEGVAHLEDPDVRVTA